MAALDLPVAILAGGLATRLQPITAKVPKLLVEVAGVHFFEHQIRLLKQAGLRHLVLCVGHHGEMIVDRYGDGARHGIRIEYSFDGPSLRGTGGALVHALPKLGDAFYVLYGDSYLPIDYAAVGKCFLRSAELGLMTVFENRGRFDCSNVHFSGGRIIAYDKRNPTPAMHHIDYGLELFRAGAFARHADSPRFELADLQHDLAAAGQLAGYEVSERFYEIGSPAGLNELDVFLRSGKIPRL